MIQRSTFKANRWLSNRHVQTLWASQLRQVETIAFQRKAITTPDQDVVYLDYIGHQPLFQKQTLQRANNRDACAPIVLMLHGLTGSSNSKYIRGFQHAVSKLGWRSLTINFRGCIEHPNHKAHSYHSGQTEDIQYIYNFIRDTEPETPLAALGFSLGGNVLLKWLGQAKKPPSLFAAAAVSVPFQLDKCANTLDTGFSRLYRAHLIQQLIKSFQLKKQYLLHKGHTDEYQRLLALPDPSNMKSFWEFDHYITAALNNFNSVQHYYQVASCRQYLGGIDIPTLIIQSEDDPFICPTAIPTDSDLSKFVTLELSRQGGHMGFIGGIHSSVANYWLEHRISQFLFAQFNSKK